MKGTKNPLESDKLDFGCRFPGLTIVEAPAEKRDFANVKEVVPFTLGVLLAETPNCNRYFELTRIHVNILALLPQQIHSKDAHRQNQTESGTPPDNWGSNEIVFRLVVAPSTHPQAEFEPWPVSWFGSEDILLVGVGDEGVVGCHHGYVEMPEIAQERRFVELHISSGH